MKLITFPLSQIYEQIMRLRNWAYDQKYISVQHHPVPVVSIGNITVGGTGKTPILCELIHWALENGLRPAIISRGYKGQIKNVAKVPAVGGADRYGDEPSMMARRFPNVPVYVGPNRVAVMAELLKNENINIVFADDGFQHRRLGRELDIVILDATEKIENYQVMPAGRAREAIEGLRRADILILNKVNLIATDQKQKIYDFLEEHLADIRQEIIEAEYYIREIRSLTDQSKMAPQVQEKVFLLSGVGNPKALEKLMRSHFNVIEHFVFPDHHHYSQAELQEIIEKAKQRRVGKIIVTEKDAVKIDDRSDIDKSYFWKSILTVKLGLKAKIIYENIKQLVH